MKRVLLLMLFIGMITYSCKKDDPEENLKPFPAADYMQLKIGNYWVYQSYQLDSAGNENPMSNVDSLIIIGDTTINGYKYFKKLSVLHDHVSYMRDSNGYLVDHLGKVFFSEHDFTNILRVDTIGPGLALAEYSMHEGDTLVNTPIGSFQSMEFRGKITAFDPQYPYGPQYTYSFYADGAGLVKSSYYLFYNPSLRVGQNLVSFGNTDHLP